MKSKKTIPIFDFFKKIDNGLHFEFFRLEEAYNPYDANLPHRHNYFEIIFFEKSGGNHDIDFEKYPIKSNSIHFISPEQVHHLKNEEGVTGFVISFTTDFFLNDVLNPAFIETLPFFNVTESSPIINLKKINEAEKVHDLIRRISDEYISTQPDKMEMISSLLLQMLLLSKRIHERDSAAVGISSSQSDFYRKYRNLVNEHFRGYKTVNAYARMLNITAGHLNDVIHQDSGKSASDILYARIILEAKRLLYHSSLSIKEISALLEYEDPSHFSRFFKNHTGQTPEKFRTTIRETSR